jgi:nucleotide-binding universal stress UspA family protein
MLRSILVALDGSPWSETATTLALDWAARFDARLLGLGVLDEPSIDRRVAAVGPSTSSTAHGPAIGRESFQEWMSS